MLIDEARGARPVLNHDDIKPFAWFGPPFVLGANNLHQRAGGVACAQLSTRNTARPNTTHSTAAVIIATATTNQNSQFANRQSKGTLKPLPAPRARMVCRKHNGHHFGIRLRCIPSLWRTWTPQLIAMTPRQLARAMMP